MECANALMDTINHIVVLHANVCQIIHLYFIIDYLQKIILFCLNVFDLNLVVIKAG